MRVNFYRVFKNIHSGYKILLYFIFHAALVREKCIVWLLLSGGAVSSNDAMQRASRTGS